MKPQTFQDSASDPAFVWSLVVSVAILLAAIAVVQAW
jgi:hypothetical protein